MKNTTATQTARAKILQAANIVTCDKRKREQWRRELRELSNHAYSLAFYEYLVQSSRRADASENNREIGIIDMQGKRLPKFIDVENALQYVRDRKANLGRQLLVALDQAEGYLSLKEFCKIFLIDFFDARRAMQECDAAAPGDLFIWLIFEYGIESVGSDMHEGILFECIQEALLADKRNSSSLHEPFRYSCIDEKTFGLLQALGIGLEIMGPPLA